MPKHQLRASGVARRALRGLIPAGARLALRQRYELLLDRIDRILGRHDPLVPPSHLMFVGGSRKDFRSLGDKWVRTFIRVAALKPDETVLDVGCGNGRMAVALTKYLSAQGGYEGFDIVLEGIEWCKQAVTSRFPNFHFAHVDLYNKEYNAGGTVQPSQFQFPYQSQFFDFVFLTSVFTHMLPGDVRHYLAEVHRVLRPSGRCLITFFLLNPEARTGIAAGAAGPGRDFRHNLGEYWTVDPQVPEAAVAYPETTVRGLFRDAGLSVDAVLYGAWCGRERTVSGHSQDIVLAKPI